MARRITVLLAALSLVMALVPSAAAASGRDPFAGVWASTDIDGSAQALVIIGRGSDRTLAYYDDGCGSCLPQGVPIYGIGPGSVSGSTLDAIIHLFVGRGVVGPSEWDQDFVAQPDGTLLQPANCGGCVPDVVWHRVRS